jgi:hypothetical protein
MYISNELECPCGINLEGSSSVLILFLHYFESYSYLIMKSILSFRNIYLYVWMIPKVYKVDWVSPKVQFGFVSYFCYQCISLSEYFRYWIYTACSYFYCAENGIILWKSNISLLKSWLWVFLDSSKYRFTSVSLKLERRFLVEI